MTSAFQVMLSSSKPDSIWGEGNLSFNESGATIHIKDLVDNAESLSQIQIAARKLASMKLAQISLVGDWSLEAQWHFWQGISQPSKQTQVNFAPMSQDEDKHLKAMVDSHQWVKDLINHTPEDMSPMNLANQVGDYLSELAPQQVSYRIIAGEELKDKGYTGIYNVGRGSERPPTLLTLDYRGNPESNGTPDIVLVGKGITFDSGGYSLKQSQSMLHMKSDMGGAATVSGALALAISQGLQKNVRLLLCCAENLVSGQAYKLSDILEYRNGVSVEVVNTDAEGRLVLADGLIDASQSEAPIILDAATLTGAAVVAVGDDYNALFCMDELLAQKFTALAEENFDPCWRLPLHKNHQNNCPSAYADTANSRPMPGGGAGGASNAAGFLSRFLNTPESGWIHLDLAACYCANANSQWAAGATGSGTRSIAALMMNL